MENGIVKFFKSEPDKLFGFIISEKGDEVFFHFNNHANYSEADRLPKGGDRVEFVRTEGKPGKGPKASEWNFSPYISFGDICHQKLGTTTQDGAHYVGGLGLIPDLSANIRLHGTAAMYQLLRIHRDDVEKFVARVKKWEAAKLSDNRAIRLFVSEEKREYFFSNNLSQTDVEGFFLKVVRLPYTTFRTDANPDGIVSTIEEMTSDYYFGRMREILNPDPRSQAPSPLSANTAS